jgi:hypothetical protein
MIVVLTGSPPFSNAQILTRATESINEGGFIPALTAIELGIRETGGIRVIFSRILAMYQRNDLSQLKNNLAWGMAPC